jgi:hypothetical protein
MTLGQLLFELRATKKGNGRTDVLTKWYFSDFSFDLFSHFLVSHTRLKKDTQDFFSNQSTEDTEFVWVSECQKGEGCEIINQFVCIVSPMLFSSAIVNWL